MTGHQKCPDRIGEFAMFVLDSPIRGGTTIHKTSHIGSKSLNLSGAGAIPIFRGTDTGVRKDGKK
ncbi:MAG: hypothetical protein DRI57_15120 [Deltaproteobacteria bacterium]|nr:MAG: hypothetical protein DRI57_15120 [Deltaproteobacteria bacterium]